MRRFVSLAVLSLIISALAGAAVVSANRGERGGATVVAAGGSMTEMLEPATTVEATTTTAATPPVTRAPVAAAPVSPPARRASAPTMAAGFPTAPIPPGSEPWGLNGLGSSTTASNGPDTLTLNLYPYDLSVDSFLQTSLEIAFVGGIGSVVFDYGDGTSVVHSSDSYGLAGWMCDDPITARKTINDGAPFHTYARAGTYRVTVTLTTVDCTGPGLPPWELPGYPTALPDGTPMVNRMPAVGQPRVTTVSTEVVQRPDRYPLPRGPVPSP